MLVCVYYCAFGTRDRGCSRHPAFPAPSKGRKEIAELGHSVPREQSLSSRRRPGPIRRGGCGLQLVVDGFARTTRPVAMGPGLRRGDSGGLPPPCAIFKTACSQISNLSNHTATA